MDFLSGLTQPYDNFEAGLASRYGGTSGPGTPIGDYYSQRNFNTGNANFGGLADLLMQISGGAMRGGMGGGFGMPRPGTPPMGYGLNPAMGGTVGMSAGMGAPMGPGMGPGVGGFGTGVIRGLSGLLPTTGYPSANEDSARTARAGEMSNASMQPGRGPQHPLIQFLAHLMGNRQGSMPNMGGGGYAGGGPSPADYGNTPNPNFTRNPPFMLGGGRRSLMYPDLGIGGNAVSGFPFNMGMSSY